MALKYNKEFDLPNKGSNPDIGSLDFRLFTKHEDAFSLTCRIEQDAFCCGLFSIGEFEVYEDNGEASQKSKIEVIQEGFEKLVSQYKTKTKEFTFIMTLIDNEACNLVFEALKNNKIFTHVKTFDNKNSKNKNHIFMSN